jgi:hypothetical protein
VFLQEDCPSRGIDALSLTSPFDETALLRENLAYVTAGLGLRRVDIYGPADDVRRCSWLFGQKMSMRWRC